MPAKQSSGQIMPYSKTIHKFLLPLSPIQPCQVHPLCWIFSPVPQSDWDPLACSAGACPAAALEGHAPVPSHPDAPQLLVGSCHQWGWCGRGCIHLENRLGWFRPEQDTLASSGGKFQELVNHLETPGTCGWCYLLGRCSDQVWIW
jgi:hypothetical protein